MAIDRIPGVGPTNADIATAVAAPSAATIAAAVAAPSSATITSAVLSAGNSAGWSNAGENWTLITNTSLNGVGTANFTSLSGYKKYKLVVSYARFGSSGNYELRCRINGNTSGYWSSNRVSNTNNTYGSVSANSDNIGTIDFMNWWNAIYYFDEANLSGPKVIEAVASGGDPSGFPRYINILGSHQDLNAAINQIQIYNASGNWTTGRAALYGVVA